MTQSTKYTPGPWTFSKTAHGEAGISILSEDRSSEGFVKWERARVGLNSNRITHETEANARLIAAAPDLLEAAKAVMFARLPQLNFDLSRNPDMMALEKAILKAEQK